MTQQEGAGLINIGPKDVKEETRAGEVFALLKTTTFCKRRRGSQLIKQAADARRDVHGQHAGVAGSPSEKETKTKHGADTAGLG